MLARIFTNTNPPQNRQILFVYSFHSDSACFYTMDKETLAFLSFWAHNSTVTKTNALSHLGRKKQSYLIFYTIQDEHNHQNGNGKQFMDSQIPKSRNARTAILS